MAGRSSTIPGLKDVEGNKKSTSGIVSRFDSEERVIPESKRPDGTVRKEKRIRPGFTPVEDVSKFRSARQQDADARKLPPGVVPGMQQMRSEVKAALSGASSASSASAKKNAKRKEKRKEEVAQPEETPDAWDAEDEPAAKAQQPATSNNTTAEADPKAAQQQQDPQKRAKALQKKIRQIQEIQQKQTSGETLQPEQQDKIKSLGSLEEELASLSL